MTEHISKQFDQDLETIIPPLLLSFEEAKQQLDEWARREET